MTLLISEQETRQLLSNDAAIPVIEEMFRLAGERKAENSERIELISGDDYLMFRAAALHAKRRIGFKILTNIGDGPVLMWNFLYDTGSGKLLAIVQSRAISNFRTSAASAVAAKYLSPPDAGVVGMFGTGKQAASQLAAICAVRPIRAAYVYSRSAEKRAVFCREMSEQLRIPVTPSESPERVPAEADILITITNTETPVLLGDWITRPCLVIGAGANEWYEREIDGKVVAKSALIVVDDKNHARKACGDLMWSVSHGLVRWDQVRELGDVISGRTALPEFSSGIILFESLGTALEDVAIANEAYELAIKCKLGREISL